MAAIWRLAIRHVFFATNHHCSFNRLHYSAAFVATDTFAFHIAGSSLFMNTFGWEIIGSILVMVLSRCIGEYHNVDGKDHFIHGRENAWCWFLFYQWTEILSSCISVSAMKRHLMVWAIFAPRFMFAAVFTVLDLALCFIGVIWN
jgi:phosphatidylinositol glycan class O